ncbi:MAG: GNAT family N-acetyltransferase [Firmicutes bacterium]|nr:GNAT family N-acetyltransferase [Bacillota bacterium]
MIRFNSFSNTKGFGDFSSSFLEVSEFLREFQKDKLTSMDFPWGRWEWMFSLPFLDNNFLDKIGIWKDNFKMVGLVTYESKFGEAYYVVDEKYNFLKEEMANYVYHHFMVEGHLRFLIPNSDYEMQDIVYKLNLRATESREMNALFDTSNSLKYELKDGFSITSMKENYNLEKYNNVLWRGFNHEGEPSNSKEDLLHRKISLSGPHVNLERDIAVVSPEGEFVAYCGTFYQDGDYCALVEPVATDPKYRKMGLGKAAVLEAIKRCKEAGAKFVIVGSHQKFYYQIGFFPYTTSTWWENI